jgi:hypothetical protein
MSDKFFILLNDKVSFDGFNILMQAICGKA